MKCKAAEIWPDSFNLSDNEELFTMITLGIWEKDFYITSRAAKYCPAVF